MTDSAIDRWMKALLASTSENGVVVPTADGVILAWLGAAERLFGYTADVAVGMPGSRLFTPEDLASQLDRQERELALSGPRSEDDRLELHRGIVEGRSPGLGGGSVFTVRLPLVQTGVSPPGPAQATG